MLAEMAVAGGLSLLSSFGASKSAKKQAKQQRAYDEEANRVNAWKTEVRNAQAEALGRELLTVPETVTDNTRQDNYSYVDVDSMMKAADRAGFNPVTWLNAGGMQAYTQSGSVNSGSKTSIGHNAAAAFQMMMPETNLVSASQAVKVPNAMQAIGDAGTAALNVYRQDTKLEQSQAFQKELLGLQIAGIQAARAKGAGVNSVGGSTPSTTTAGSASGGWFSRPGDTATTYGNPNWEADAAKVSNPWPSGWMKVDPRTSNADSFSNRYGDIAEEIAGMYNLINDGTFSATGKNIPTNIRDGWAALSSIQPNIARNYNNTVGAPYSWNGLAESINGFGSAYTRLPFKEPNRESYTVGSD